MLWRGEKKNVDDMNTVNTSKPERLVKYRMLYYTQMSGTSHLESESVSLSAVFSKYNTVKKKAYFNSSFFPLQKYVFMQCGPV